MEENTYINLLKIFGYISSICGLVVGLDLILGARITTVLKRILEKSYDLEGTLKRVLEHKTFDLDKLIATPRIKMVLGVMFFGFSLLIFLLLKQIK